MSTTYAINAGTLGVTSYSDLSAIDLAFIGGKTFVLKTTGLYEQDGQGGELLAWRVKTGKLRLTQNGIGVAYALLVLGKTENAVEVIVRADEYGEETEQRYRLEYDAVSEKMGQLQPLARDVQADSWEFELLGTGLVELDAVYVLVDNLTQDWQQ